MNRPIYWAKEIKYHEEVRECGKSWKHHVILDHTLDLIYVVVFVVPADRKRLGEGENLSSGCNKANFLISVH